MSEYSSAGSVRSSLDWRTAKARFSDRADPFNITRHNDPWELHRRTASSTSVSDTISTSAPRAASSDDQRPFAAEKSNDVHPVPKRAGPPRTKRKRLYVIGGICMLAVTIVALAAALATSKGSGKDSSPSTPSTGATTAVYSAAALPSTVTVVTQLFTAISANSGNTRASPSSSSTRQSTPSKLTSKPTNSPGEEASMLVSLNAVRTARSLQPLQWDGNLAGWAAQEVATCCVSFHVAQS